MKQAMVLIGLMIVGLQYKLWCEHDSVLSVVQLKQAIHEQELINDKLSHSNLALRAQVDDLKQGSAAIEELARSEIGFIKKGEIFFQFIQK